MSNSNCCFLTCTQISQEGDQEVWYSHLFQSLPQFTVTHTVEGFGTVSKTEADVFLELSLFWCWQFDFWFFCLFCIQLNLWKFMTHILLKPGLENSEHHFAAAAAKSLQSCPSLCDPIDGSPPGSRPWDSPGKTLERVAISFSIAWKWKVKVKSLSRVRLLATPWTAAHQAPPSMRCSRQEDWSGLPLSKWGNSTWSMWVIK